MKKGIKYSLLGLLAVIIIALTGASFYMLGYSLRPEHNKGKDIPGSYEYMLSEYPQIKPWIDSLQTAGALRDTFISTLTECNCMPFTQPLPNLLTKQPSSCMVIRTIASVC